MRVVRHLLASDVALRGGVATVGNFDGVHAGHQAILARLLEWARRLGAAAQVVTFAPHPIGVLNPAHAPPALLTVRDRLALLGALGVDVVLLKRFTRAFAELPPETFVERFLVGDLGVRHVVVGYNLNFGRHRAGTVETLRALGKAHGFGVDVVGPVEVDGAPVSSTRIRALLRRGEVRSAARLLGRSHCVRGHVVPGEGRGEEIGFPTANLRTQSVLLPAEGVYAVRAEWRGAVHGGVANLGRRPTFGGTDQVLEAHLFGLHEPLYGERLRVSFVERLRGEQRFGGPDALAEQIRRDVARARVLLEGG